MAADRSENRGRKASAPISADTTEAAKALRDAKRNMAAREADLQALADEQVPEIDDENDTSFIVDSYHYYDGRSFASKARADAASIRKARALLSSQVPPKIRSVKTGYVSTYNTPSGKEPGGEITVSPDDASWYARLVFVRGGVISGYCSQCFGRWGYGYHEYSMKSSMNRKPCVHETAAILLLADYLDHEDTTDSTDIAADRFFASALPSGSSPDRRPGKTALTTQVLHLEPRLESPRGGWMLCASFYIGTQRLYKVKDIPDLLRGFDGRKTQTFGRSTELYLSEDSLDPQSAGWLSFIRDEYEAFCRMKNRIRAQEGENGYDSVADGLSFPPLILLDEDRIDRFYDMQKGKPIDYTNRSDGDGKKRQLRLAEGGALLPITLSPVYTPGGRTFEGVSLTSPPVHLIRGSAHQYQVTESSLIRIESNHPDLMCALAASSTDDGIRMTIGRGKLSDFYHRLLPQLREVAQITEKNPAVVEKYIVPDPVYHFYLDEQDRVVYGRGDVSYGNYSFSLGDWSPQNASPVTASFRRSSGESRVYGRLFHYLSAYDPKTRLFYMYMDDDQLFDLLDHGVQELMDIGEVHVTERFQRLRLKKSMPVEIGVRLQSGLMDLSISSQDLSPEELLDILSAYRRKSHFVRLKNGDFLKLDGSQEIAALEQMLEEMRIPLQQFVSGHMQLPAYRALYLEHMLAGMEDVYASRDSHYKALVRAFKDVEDADYPIPAGLRAKLRNYQADGYQWLRTLDEYRFGGILADEMGLGKTLQAIACILSVRDAAPALPGPSVQAAGGTDAALPAPAALTAHDADLALPGSSALTAHDADLALPAPSRPAAHDAASALPAPSAQAAHDAASALPAPSALTAGAGERSAISGRPSRTSLVICPASLVYNWGEELRKFAPSLTTVLIAGTVSERRALIGRIEDFDVAVTSYDLLKRDIDRYEGHRFRFAIVDEAQNMKNPLTAAAKSVKLIQAQTRFALTGTPIENKLSELWSIFDFIMPGYLYDYQTFRDEIENPIARYGDEKARDRLRRMAAPFILRRKKTDVLKDLPDKLEEVRYARMEKTQQQLYDAEVVRMKNELRSQSEEEFRRNQIQILAELTKIRQICCDPSLLFENYRGTSAKTEMCMQLIESLIEGEHRALIFSQFTSMFGILEKRLQAEGIPYFKITGETPKKRRLELVNDFNSGSVPVFLISLRAGGTGLNLTGADVVIHYDPWWNLAVQNQATDRAHRIGQTKTVTVFKLIIKGSIEEKIMELQESKKELAEGILEGEGTASTKLSREDLMKLLG